MFKKRTRPVSVRKKAPVEDVVEEKVASGANSDPEDDEGDGRYAILSYQIIYVSWWFADRHRSNVEELILLRKLRRSQPGIDLEKLNRGEERRKGKKRDSESAAEKYGLQTQRAKEGEKDERVVLIGIGRMLIRQGAGRRPWASDTAGPDQQLHTTNKRTRRG